ncbi:hypothetical protein ACQJBY_041449 [Aegilops geniculata]
MSNFALGLTKTAVEGTLSRVQLAIDEENKLRETAKQDLRYITAEFQMMQSFLKVANKERANNEVVKTWVKQLRDLAFDVEDCVEFVVHLDNNDSSLTWLWRVVPSCMAPPQTRDLDKVVAELKALKARVEDVSQRNTRYNLISDASSQAKTTSPNEQAAMATTNPSAFHILTEVWEAVGKRSDMSDLQKLIMGEGSDLQIISVWGSTAADLGTTPIFSMLYGDPEICRAFKRRAWVKLMCPFKPDEFLKSLLTQLSVSSDQESIDVDHLTKAELMQQVKAHKYLIILEEVFSVVDWDAIRVYLPNNGNGSRIIVSTKQLRTALVCTGEPYQVSELRRFSDDQSLCAFSKKVGRRSGMRGLIWQIRCRGVVSVWGLSDDKSAVINKVYTSIVYKCKQFNGVEFQRHSWVDVPVPFSLEVFSRRLLLSFRSEDLQAEEIAIVGMMGEPSLTHECCKFLHEDDCLVVINDLQSAHDWGLIKAAFLSEPVKGCILIITNESSVATHCAEEEDGALNIRDLEADTMLRPLIKGCASRVFSNTSAEARDFVNTFRLLGHQNRSAWYLRRSLSSSGPSVSSVWGIAGVGKSFVVRNLYCHLMLGLEQIFKFSAPGPRTEFTMCSWVDVRHPFNLTDLSWHLLLDFHSHDLQAKEKAAIGIMEGQDQVQECRRILCEHRSLVVIDGLRSKEDWDFIKAAFLPDSTNACIIVITNEASVATHCVDNKKDQVVNVKGLEADAALSLFKKMIQGGNELTSGDKVAIRKCGGIPKVIANIGEVTDLFGMADQGCHSLRDLFSWMRSYFEGCSDSLKPCIFYLSIFPPEHNVRRRRWLRRWIAEGYCRDTYSGTAEENGNMLFLELISLSIIQQCQKAGKYLYQVNGFFHEYIISRPMEDNLVFSLEGNCSPNSQHAGQHLTIREDWDRDITVFRSMDFSRLRSLTVFGKWMPFFLSSNMSLLRVLDLADTSGILDADLEQIVKVLPRLKFLSLRGCKEIRHLPKSLGGLRQLQTLDVKHTSIVMLPLCIIKLQKLQYIRAGTIISSDEGDDAIASIPTTVDQTSTPSESSDDVVTTLPETTEEIQTSTLPETTTELQTLTPPEGSDDVVTALPEMAEVQTSTPLSWSCRSCSLVSSWLSKLHKHQLDNGGVEVPIGIGSLTALHTIGVVNANIPNGKAILKALKNITQLRKLSLSGINRQNIQELCYFISGHNHLESLSVQLDKDKQGLFACFDDMISQPPKTLKSLKLYGHVNKLPIWIEQLDNLQKLDLELTIQLQDMHFLGGIPKSFYLRRLCLKLIQDGELHFSTLGGHYFCGLRVLEINCTSKLHVTFVRRVLMEVEVLKIHCSGGASLWISGLEHLFKLNEVWLKGSYSDKLKQELQQLSEHTRKPVLKLVQRRSS